MRGLLIWAVLGFIVSSLVIADEAKISPDGWRHESEVGISVKGGNSSTETYRANHWSTYQWSGNILKGTADYFYSLASRVEIAKKWALMLRYERDLSPAIRAYLDHGYQGDIFAGYQYIAVVGTGGRYFIIKGDKKDSYLSTELGYRVQYENRIASAISRNKQAHFVRIYFEGARQISETMSAKLWVEILPDISNSTNFNMNFEPSLSVVLMGNFFLKVAFQGAYDGEPALTTKKTFDYMYTTSLVAKF